jgi:hypothetical protein
MEKMVRRRGDKWVVLDSSGKRVLGEHKTRRDALRQLRAIEAHKYGKRGDHV